MSGKAPPGLAEIHRVFPKSHWFWVPPGLLQLVVVLKKMERSTKLRATSGTMNIHPNREPQLAVSNKGSHYHIGNKKWGSQTRQDKTRHHDNDNDNDNDKDYDKDKDYDNDNDNDIDIDKDKDFDKDKDCDNDNDNDKDKDKTRQDKTRQDKTRQDKTRQDKTRQDKTRQDKTRQDKTRQ